VDNLYAHLLVYIALSLTVVYASNSNAKFGGYFKIFFIIEDINNLDAKFQGYFMYFFIKVRLFVIFLEK
jgi:hypothetical protein